MGTWSKRVILVCGLVAVGCGGKSGNEGVDGTSGPDQKDLVSVDEDSRTEEAGPGDVRPGDEGCGDCGRTAEIFDVPGADETTGPDLCTPQCTGKDCGDDGCGGSCGECSGTQDVCSDGVCMCQPECDGTTCGEDGCGGTCSCDDGVDCTVDGCSLDLLCEHLALDVLCDDGNSCTVDSCSAEIGCACEGISFGACGPRESCVAGECVKDPHPEGAVSATGNSCFVKTDGTVWCWGRNDYGQIGLGAPSDEVTTPAKVLGVSGMWRVDDGGDHACALKDDGTVWCWGECPYELCACPGPTCLEPVQVVGPSWVVEIEAGAPKDWGEVPVDCALTAKGRIWCWGAWDKWWKNMYWSSFVLKPTELPDIGNAVGLSTRQDRVCYVDSGGAVWCLQLMPDKSGSPVFSPPEMVEGLPGQVVKFESRGDVSCAVLVDGTAWCWGANQWGQLGNGTFQDSDVAVQVPGLADVVDIQVSLYHVCALDSGGTAWCWGANHMGQLGTGATGDIQPSPVKVVAVPEVASIGVGIYHGCALGQDESVWCWGGDFSGQVGVGRVLENAPPAPVAGLTGVVSLDLSYRSAYALDTGGTRRGWGYDACGQLGDGEQWIRSVPIETEVDQPVMAISAADVDSYVALEDGTVEGWGCDESLEGNLVEGIPAAVDLGSGPFFSCAIDSEGSVTCWGWGGADAVSLGIPGNALLWSKVVGLPPVVEVVSGDEHSCARTPDGFVWCWGHGYLGQLGNGAEQDSTAVPVNGLGGVLGVSAGRNATCAVLVEGTVWCWGSNVFGQLGQEGVGTSSVPLMVPGLEGAIAVGLGYQHACAVLGPDGTVWCWGNNEFGQLGDGTTTDSFEPVQVKGVTGAGEVAGGSDATCALMLDGTVWCWGNDEKGQLGREGPYKITPVPVVGFP